MTIREFIFVGGLRRAVTLNKTSFCITICGDDTVQYNAIKGQDLGESHSVLPHNNSRGKSGDPSWTETSTHLARMTTQIAPDISRIINLGVISTTLLTGKNWSV